MKKGITLKGKEIAGRGGNRGRAGPRSKAKKEMEKRKGIKRGREMWREMQRWRESERGGKGILKTKSEQKEPWGWNRPRNERNHEGMWKWEKQDENRSNKERVEWEIKKKKEWRIIVCFLYICHSNYDDFRDPYLPKSPFVDVIPGGGFQQTNYLFSFLSLYMIGIHH